MHMYSFKTREQAVDFVSSRIDRPVQEATDKFSDGLLLHSSAIDLGDGAFTNMYDLSYPVNSINPSIDLHDTLKSVVEHSHDHPELSAVSSGAFFFLADQADATPLHSSLNLALSNKQVYGLPVVDREALLLTGNRLTAEYVQSLGAISVNGTELSWSGSLTNHDTDVKIYGNGNCVIRHEPNDVTGLVRALDETSHYTPPMQESGLVDIGFRRRDGIFIAHEMSHTGSMDIFRNDIVMRLNERHTHKQRSKARVISLGDRAVDGSLRSGISVGPLLRPQNFNAHPINQDRSLGDKPPFTELPMARSALFETDDGRIHIRIFDGRPGSLHFPGVTPSKALELVCSDSTLVWGCFLDPGQSAKLAVRENSLVHTYGNAHYLRWPTHPDEDFVWEPDRGRPTANAISFSVIT